VCNYQFKDKYDARVKNVTFTRNVLNAESDFVLSVLTVDEDKWAILPISVFLAVA